MKVGLVDRLRYYLFGYDFFISYRWSDGRLYALRLQEALVNRGLVVFLDSSDYAKGDHWREEGRRALHRSSRLLLVCSPDVHDSKAVLHEVEIFSSLGRRILPIDIRGSLRSRESALSSLIPAEVLCFSEPSPNCLFDGPSQQIVDDVVKSFDLIRQHVRRVRWLSGAVVVLACALVAALGAALYAEGRRRDAEWRRLVAEGRRADATLNGPAQWAAGLALATAAGVSALRTGLVSPEEVRFALMRGVWLATPYRVLMNDARRMSRATFAPTSGRVLAIDGNGVVSLLDPHTGIVTALPLEDLGKSRMATISKDEQMVATVTDTGVGVWRTTSGRLVRSLPIDPKAVVTVMFTLDGKRIITAGADGSVLSWPANGGGEDVIQPVGTEILGAALSPTGQSIAIVDDEPRARIVDLTTRATRATLELDEKAPRIVSIAFSPDGRYVVTGGQDEAVKVWSAETGERLAITTRAHFGEVTNAAFSPDNSSVVSAGFDGTLRVWSIDDRSAFVLFGHSGPVTAAVFSPDGRYVLSSSEDGTIRLWDAHPFRNESFVVIDGQMKASCGHAVSLAGDRVVTVSGDGSIRIADTGSGRTLKQIPGRGGAIRSAALSGDGSLAVIAKDSAPPVVLDVQTGALVAKLPKCGYGCTIDLSPDGQSVIVAGLEVAELRRIDGEGVVELPRVGKTYGATFAPNGVRVATTGSDGRFRVCAVSGTQCSEVDAHTVYGETVCFDPNSQRLVSGGGDRLAKVWKANGEHALTLSGHPDAVRSAVFSRDSRYVYTLSDEDGTVRIWDSVNGALVGRLDLPDTVSAVVELPNNRLAITVGKQTWIGSIDLGSLVRRACHILRPLDSIIGVSQDTIREVHEGCEAISLKLSTNP